VYQPTIRFDAQPTTVQPLTVQFADQTQICAQNRSWDFGDGMTSTTRYPIHIYPFPGTYTARLDLTFCDPDESSESPKKEITVLPVERQDTLLSGLGSASIDTGGSLFFVVKGPARS
jgi:PKD repeat protein